VGLVVHHSGKRATWHDSLVVEMRKALFRRDVLAFQNPAAQQEQVRAHLLGNVHHLVMLEPDSIEAIGFQESS